MEQGGARGVTALCLSRNPRRRSWRSTARTCVRSPPRCASSSTPSSRWRSSSRGARSACSKRPSASMPASARTSSPSRITGSKAPSTTACGRWECSRARAPAQSAPMPISATSPIAKVGVVGSKMRSSESRAPSPAWRWSSAPASTAPTPCRCLMMPYLLTSAFSSSRCAGGCAGPSRSCRKKSENCCRATTSRTRLWKRLAPRSASRRAGPVACTRGRLNGSSNFWKMKTITNLQTT